MAYRWRPKNADVDPDNPSAWGQCDRCGMIWNLNQLQWQYAFQGTTVPQNTRFLVCPKHLDPLNPQDTPLILPPDPLPVFNARTGATDTAGEASWLTTEDGSILVTEDGTYIGTAIPDPATDASTAHLEAVFSYPGGDVSVAYLDIFDGDPMSGGVSVLASITGSVTRTNIAASLTTISGVARNPAQIVVAAASGATTNTNYMGLYSASISGALMIHGPLHVRGQTVSAGRPVVFSPVAINIDLSI